jgi:hypothetical protein
MGPDDDHHDGLRHALPFCQNFEYAVYETRGFNFVPSFRGTRLKIKPL